MSVSAKTVMCGAAAVAISGVAVSAASFKGTATNTTTPWWKIPTVECKDSEAWAKRCESGDADETTAPPQGCTPCNYVPSISQGPNTETGFAGTHRPRQVIIKDVTYVYAKNKDDPTNGTCYTGLTGLQNTAPQARDNTCTYSANAEWQKIVQKYCVPLDKDDCIGKNGHSGTYNFCEWNFGKNECEGRKQDKQFIGQVTSCLKQSCVDGSTPQYGSEKCVTGEQGGNSFSSGALFKGADKLQSVEGKTSDEDCKAYAEANVSDAGQVLYQWQLTEQAGQAQPYKADAGTGTAQCWVYGYSPCKTWVKDPSGNTVCEENGDNFDAQDAWGGVQTSATAGADGKISGLNIVLSGGGQYGTQLQSNTYLCPTKKYDSENCKLLTMFGTFPDHKDAKITIDPKDYPEDPELRVVTVYLVTGPGVWSPTTTTTPAPQ